MAQTKGLRPFHKYNPSFIPYMFLLLLLGFFLFVQHAMDSYAAAHFFRGPIPKFSDLKVVNGRLLDIHFSSSRSSDYAIANILTDKNVVFGFSCSPSTDRYGCFDENGYKKVEKSGKTVKLYYFDFPNNTYDPYDLYGNNHEFIMHMYTAPQKIGMELAFTKDKAIHTIFDYAETSKYLKEYIRSSANDTGALIEIIFFAVAIVVWGLIDLRILIARRSE